MFVFSTTFISNVVLQTIISTEFFVEMDKKIILEQETVHSSIFSLFLVFYGVSTCITS